MSESQIEAKIMEAFDGKIPDLADVELLMSVHTALVVPNLHGTWSIDDVILHRLFKDKRVYVRPSRVYVLLLVLCFIESTISLFYWEYVGQYFDNDQTPLTWHLLLLLHATSVVVGIITVEHASVYESQFFSVI